MGTIVPDLVCSLASGKPGHNLRYNGISSMLLDIMVAVGIPLLGMGQPLLCGCVPPYSTILYDTLPLFERTPAI